MESFTGLDAEPDSAELLMMEMQIPEPMNQEDLDSDYHSAFSKDKFNDFDTMSSSTKSSQDKMMNSFTSFIGCHRSKDFTLDGLVGTNEMDRTLKWEQPFDLVEDELNLFGLPASFYSPIEEPELYTKLFCQRFHWILQRCTPITSKKMVPHRFDNLDSDSKIYDLEAILNEMTFFLGVLRFLSYKLTKEENPSEVDVLNLVRLLHTIHLQTGKISDLPYMVVSSMTDSFHQTNSDSRSDTNTKTKTGLFHVVVATKWTILSCLRFLTKLSVKEDSLVLPSFCKFVGQNWRNEILFENHVDSLSSEQLGRIFQQFASGLLLELAWLSDSRLKSVKIASKSDSFSFVSKQSAFVCSCVKELWLVLIHIFDEDGFWVWFSTLFEASQKCMAANSSAKKEVTVFLPNSLQYEFQHTELSIQLTFWLLNNIGHLCLISPDGQSLPSENVLRNFRGVQPIVENLLKRFTNDISNKYVNELETRSYFNVIRQLSIMSKGSSINILVLLWDIIHPKLNESFSSDATSLHRLAVLPSSYSHWIEQIGKNIEHVDRSDKNSFEMFLSILAIHLSESISEQSKVIKISKQFFGRVRIKLSSQKWSSLDERGIYHAMSLFITLVKIRHDVLFIIDGLVDSLSSIQTDKLKGSIIFKGLCAIYVCMVEKCKDHPENKFAALPKAFKALISQLELVINKGTPAQKSDMIENYATLMKDPVCLSSELVIAEKMIFNPCLIKYLESGTSGEIVHSFYNIVLRLLRYYQDVDLTKMNQLCQEELEVKNGVDATSTQIWTHLYPLIKNHLCLVKFQSSSFGELAELAYGLTVWSHHSRSTMSHLWSGSNGPPFEDPKNIFKIFAAGQHIHPLVSCIYLRLFLQGELFDVQMTTTILESWARCAILIQASNTNEENLRELRETTTEVFKLDLFRKVVNPNQESSLLNGDIMVNLIVAVGVRNEKSPEIIPQIQKDCSAIVNSYVQLLCRQQDDENVKIRLIHIGSLFVKHWTKPFMNYFDKTRVILDKTILKNEYLSESFAMSANLKKQMADRNILLSILQGIEILLMSRLQGNAQQYLTAILKVYLFKFDLSDSNPFVRVLRLPELPNVQRHFYSYIDKAIFADAKKIRQKRKPLFDALRIVRQGLNKQTEVVLGTLCVDFFCILIDIFLAFSHEENHLSEVLKEIFKIILDFSKSLRTKGSQFLLHQSLEGPNVQRFLREKFRTCRSTSMFEVLNLIASWDPQLIRNLETLLRETVANIEKQRYSSNGIGMLTKSLNALLTKANGSC